MNTSKYIFLGIEGIGAVVVLLVWMALTNYVVIFPETIPMISMVIYGMYWFATITMIMTIFRSSELINYRILTVCGIALLIMGASIPYLVPEYFHWAVNVHQWYWLRVSVYSVPAICIEGAIFTLFVVLHESGLEHRTAREKLLLTIGFVLYAILTVAWNFMSINRSITVDSHILFAKIIAGIVFVCTLIMIMFHKKPSPKIH
jgi:hypothetical protein